MEFRFHYQLHISDSLVGDAEHPNLFVIEGLTHFPIGLAPHEQASILRRSYVEHATKGLLFGQGPEDEVMLLSRLQLKLEGLFRCKIG